MKTRTRLLLGVLAGYAAMMAPVLPSGKPLLFAATVSVPKKKTLPSPSAVPAKPSLPALPTPRPSRAPSLPTALAPVASEAAPFGVRVLAADRMAIRVPEGQIQFSPPRSGRDVPGPILAFRGPDAEWRGAGWVEARKRVVAIDGSPEDDEFVVTYAFEDGGRADVRFRVPASGDHVLVTEECANCSATWVLSFAENFAADRVVAKPTAGDDWSGLRRARSAGEFRHGRIVFWSQFGRLFDFNDWMAVFGGRAVRDGVGFLRVHSESWNHPAINYLSLLERNGSLRLEGNWQTGRRCWVLVVAERMDSRGDDLRQRLLAVERQWVWKQDDWILDWEDPVAHYRPQLSESERRDKELVLRECDRLLSLLKERGFLAPPDTRPFVPVYQTYAQLKQLGVLAPDEDRRARRALAALAYNCFSKDLFPWDRAILAPGHPDSLEPLYRGMASATYNIERAAIVGDLGLILSRHPMARIWADHGADQFRLAMKSYVYPGGFWEEGISGAYDALLFLTPMAARMQKAGADFLTEPRFVSLWEFFIHSATPRVADWGNIRSFPPVGERPDHARIADLMLLGASVYSSLDPLLASRLLWLHREMGGDAQNDPGCQINALAADQWRSGGGGVRLGLPTGLTTAPQTLSSVNLPGLGAILRAREPTGDETCLLLRNGLAWGRSLNDDGAVHVWAKGVALVTDAGRGGPGEWQALARGHSRVAFSDFEPAWFFDGIQHGYRTGHRGQVGAFASLAAADYVRGDIPVTAAVVRDPQSPFSHQAAVQLLAKPITHRRHILFLKPDYFVIRDCVQGDLPHDLWFHVASQRAVIQQAAWRLLGPHMPVVTFEHPRAVYLDVFFALPEPAPLLTSEVHTSAGLTHYVMASGQGSSDYLTVLYPRRKGENRPRARRMDPVRASGQSPQSLPQSVARPAGILEIESADSLDLIVLDETPRIYLDRAQRIGFDASIAAIRRKHHTWSAVLIAGKTITLPGLTIRPGLPLSFFRDRRGAMAFESAPHDRPVRIVLEGRWLEGARLRVEGQPPRPLVGLSADITLAPGITRFAIE